MTVALPTASEITAALIAREELPAEKGDIGPQGLQGPDGQFGPPGPQGPKGDPGRDGVDGAPGDLGPIGPQGKQGDRGLKGDKGDKGDEGDRGEQGPIGPTGASGSGRSFFPRGGGSSSGSGLPPGGTVGQVPVNTAPGVAGAWGDRGGLPSQWTDGGSGDVTATTDDGTTPITVEGAAIQNGPLLLIKGGTDQADDLERIEDVDGNALLAVLPGGRLDLRGPRDASASTGDYLRIYDSLPNSPFFRITNKGYVDINPNDPTVIPLAVGSVLIIGPEDGSLPAVDVDPHNGQVGLRVVNPYTDGDLLLVLAGGALDAVFRVGFVAGVPSFGIFDKAATPAAQPAAPTTMNEVIAAMRGYGLTGA